MGGLTRARLVSVEGVSESRRCFGAFISARKIPFPGNGDRGSQRPVRYQRLLFRLIRERRSLSPEKLFDRVACANVFCGKSNGDSGPAIEGRKRPRDLDTFFN
jgi:hypothetical protein